MPKEDALYAESPSEHQMTDSFHLSRAKSRKGPAEARDTRFEPRQWQNTEIAPKRRDCVPMLIEGGYR